MTKPHLLELTQSSSSYAELTEQLLQCEEMGMGSVNAVQLPPARSADPFIEGVQGQVTDFWGLICDLTLALGDTPLEEIVWRYELESYTFILNVTATTVDLPEARMLGSMECRVLHRIGDLTRIAMRVTPWDCVYNQPDHDYEALELLLEDEIERLLELDKAVLE